MDICVRNYREIASSVNLDTARQLRYRRLKQSIHAKKWDATQRNQCGEVLRALWKAQGILCIKPAAS
jgi:hypothetical protein